MKRLMKRVGWSCLVLGAWLPGCIELPDFPPAYLVQRPRILAIVADPPEFTPGQDVHFSVMVSSDEIDQVEWRLCPGFYAAGPSQYDEGIDDEGCAGDMSWPLPPGRETTLSGAASAGLAVANLDGVPDAVLGVPLSEELLSQVIAEVGFPLQVEVRVHTPVGVLTGLKRILVSGRAGQNQNPPPPHLQIGDVTVVHREGFECEAEGGGPVLLPPGEEVEIVPLFEGNPDPVAIVSDEVPEESEPWLESYRVLDAKGQLADRVETAFYTYFTTAGKLASRTTRAPLRNNLFRMPASGCARLWVVQQDGHAGESACGFVVWDENESNPADDCPMAERIE